MPRGAGRLHGPAQASLRPPAGKLPRPALFGGGWLSGRIPGGRGGRTTGRARPQKGTGAAGARKAGQGCGRFTRQPAAAPALRPAVGDVGGPARPPRRGRVVRSLLDSIFKALTIIFLYSKIEKCFL